VTPSLGQTIRAGLIFPLLLVGVLAGALGFAAGRAVYPKTSVARVSTVMTNAAVPTPTPSGTPLSTAPPSQSSSSGGGGSGGSDSSCPSGCECRHPAGGIVIVCHGGSAVRIP
jgi:hypothetical protein